jgi:hypothetical protein
MAEKLDAHFGGSHLTGYADRIARSDFGRRAPLAARYAVLAHRQMKDGAAVQDLLRDLRAARLTDILLGALVHAGNNPDRPEESELHEYLALARATRDPWFELEAPANLAWNALWKDDVAVAQAALSGPKALCEGAATIGEPCLEVFRLLTHTYLKLHRPGAAQRTLVRAQDLARVEGNAMRETDLLNYSHMIATMRDDTSGGLMPLAIAYVDEWSAESDSCADAHEAQAWKAMALINHQRLDDARVLMATNRCEAPWTTTRAFVLAQLLQHQHESADSEILALRREIATLRAGVGPGESAFLDHVEGRLLIERMPKQGHALLRRAISSASELPDDIKAVKARSYSYSVLVETAARRAANDEALALLAEDRHLPAPERCALGVAGETSTVFVARGADGTAMGKLVALEPGEPMGTHSVPTAIVSALAGCESVDVFARQPYYGRPELLPRDMAWQFRTGARTTEPPRGSGDWVVVANIDAPKDLELAPLRPVPPVPGPILIEGPTATPNRVMAAAVDASFLEIHAHGLLGGDDSDTSLLVLAADARGRYSLGGEEIKRTRLRRAPVVVLAACHASAIGGGFHSTWGLADAFATAGASAVIASPDPIQDAGAPRFFQELRLRMAAGQAPAAALRDQRLARGDPRERAWVDRLIVFR